MCSSDLLAIANQHAAAAVDGNGMRRGEDAGTAAVAAPGADQRAVGGEAMDAGIAVAVGDVDLAVARLGRRRRMVERRVERGPMPLAQPDAIR